MYTFIMESEKKWHTEPAICASSAILNAKFRQLMDGEENSIPAHVAVFGSRVQVCDLVIIQRGSRFDDEVYVGVGVRVESGAVIGEGTQLTHEAYICEGAEIGPGCEIGGFIGDNVKVGEKCKIDGSIVHTQSDYFAPWDAPSSVEPAATIGKNVLIEKSSIIIGSVTIGDNSRILMGAIVTKDVPPDTVVNGNNEHVSITEWVETSRTYPDPMFGGFPCGGYPSDFVLQKERPLKAGSIGNNTWVGELAVIYSGAELGESVVVDHGCRIEPAAQIGKNTLVNYKANIGFGASVGSDSVIGGFVCAGAKIGNRCRVFGSLNPHARLVGSSVEMSGVPTIEDNVLIGWGASVMGGCIVGAGSIVSAGATVTKDVPPKTVVVGNGWHISMEKWKGSTQPLTAAAYFDAKQTLPTSGWHMAKCIKNGPETGVALRQTL